MRRNCELAGSLKTAKLEKRIAQLCADKYQLALRLVESDKQGQDDVGAEEERDEIEYAIEQLRTLVREYESGKDYPDLRAYSAAALRRRFWRE
jgi:hypothetical protein